MKKNTKGITLIALVITIIVLLILAGVSIAMLTGDNGILTQAQNAKNKTERGKVNEKNTLESYEQMINASTGVTLGAITGDEKNNTITQDSLGNRVVVPAGFKVVNPNENVEDGIIIEDVSHGDTVGSQFVWIPVGTGLKKKDGTKFDIKLSRYVFDASGIPSDRGSNILGDLWQELNIGKKNSTAKENIESENEGFRGSTIANGGYYIGRYEARDGETDTERTDLTEDTNQITLASNNYIYNYVTQPQAASLSQEMYNDDNFESDLMNSYARDTAVYFLQKCDDRKDKSIPYSKQTGVIPTFAPQGTNNLNTKDIICNIYDMASNCIEFTTETADNENGIVMRGGGFNSKSNQITAARIGTPHGDDIVISFRPVLCLNY